MCPEANPASLGIESVLMLCVYHFCRCNRVEVCNCPIGLVLIQFFELSASCSNGKHLGANRSPTTNIQWSVSHNQHFLILQPVAHQQVSPFARNRCNLVTFLMVVRKSAGFE